MKGSYILLIKLSGEQTITVGSLKSIHFPPGYYAYVGSALGGVEARVSRHLKTDKKLHWHIDYLLQKARVDDVIICETRDRIECTIAQALDSHFDCIPGFGSSDCKCHSHLFLATEAMKPEIVAILNSLGMQPRLAERNNNSEKITL